MAGPVIEEGREFKIDDAKPSVGDAVSDVAQLAIFVPHAELLQFRKKGDLSFRVELFDSLAAIGGDDPQALDVDLQKARYKGAAALFEMPQDTDFVFESFPRHVTAKSFVHPTVETNAHGRPRRIFHLTHEQRFTVRGRQALASVGSNARVGQSIGCIGIVS
jgi:hypothetical protein